MKELEKRLKQNNISSCYLFYGTEQYLKTQYTNLLKKTVLEPSAEIMNLDIFEGNKQDISAILDSADTLPFLSEKRLVIVKESELFQTGRKNDTEKMSDYIKTIPDTTCIVFIENAADKRGKLYKTISKYGYIAEMNGLSEKELLYWIIRECKRNKFQIETKIASYLLYVVGGEMIQLEKEIKKLGAFLPENSQATSYDIDIICIKSLETKIFDLLNAMINGQSKQAITIYHNLLLMKESPLMILAMIIRQFRMILQCKILLEQVKVQSQIAEKMGLRDFMVKQYVQQSKYFNIEELRQALEFCLQVDINIKTGKWNSELAVELLLLQYSKK
ncbi:DNA polymerase III subunit delta [Clostridium sp. MD294]|uniref:DNA polymerase III subunit delta n=1 Tax=Clostridium sp. MD294 TaxID=97138 RepID=UPI0002CBD43E|nr:DNA polymerase III subunit delta [Clostridium sp. MD294]NDO45714.1 DNA polymerase III subunit delta [Clostridium sp. MD294]USF30631.1 putative protein YqeN [Clostridium sp. MD294]